MCVVINKKQFYFYLLCLQKIVLFCCCDSLLCVSLQTNTALSMVKQRRYAVNHLWEHLVNICRLIFGDVLQRMEPLPQPWHINTQTGILNVKSDPLHFKILCLSTSGYRNNVIILNITQYLTVHYHMGVKWVSQFKYCLQNVWK